MAPIPVFLSGESHGQRSLAGYSPWGHKQTRLTKHSTARGDYFEIYTNIKSLCCTPETNTILCVNYFSI